MKNLLLVALGGCLGSVARYVAGGWILHLTAQQRFPYATFAVNVVGCLIAGLLAGLADGLDLLGREARLFLFTGVLGGFTTFSAFGLETAYLLRRGELAVAAAYVIGSVGLGVVAVWLGMRCVAVFSAQP
jgi:fluoride exporter